MPLPELNPIDVSASLSAPDVSDLTTGSVDGTGVFDTLMRTAKAHLMEEYDANRISGAEYTTVYLGTMNAVLQQSVAYILNHQQKEKVSAEIGLIRQQTVTELTQTDDAIPAGLGFNDSTAVEGLVKSKKDLEAQQILSATAQVDIANEEIELAKTKTKISGQQLITELAQTDDTLSAEAMAYGFNGTSTIEGFIAAQKNKVQAEITHINEEKLLTTQRIDTEKAQTNDLACAEGIVKEQKAKIVAETLLVGKQEDLVDKEVLLTTQKTQTEKAQTDNTISDLGLVGTQKNKLMAEIALISQQKTTELAQVDEVTSATGLIGAQKAKLTSEKLFTDQKTETEKAQTVDTYCLEGLAQSQKDKIDAEKVLLSQKSITELAQTSDSVVNDTDALNTSVTLGGMSAAQKILLTRQSDGFLRDAEQKLAKMLLDTWSVRATVDGPETVNGLDPTSIAAVITKAKAGIGT